MRRARGVAWLAACLAAVPSPTHALAVVQVVEGHLLEGGTATPIEGGILGLHTAEGTTVAQAESDSTGYFRLQAPAPGLHFLTAEKIGYRDLTHGDFELAEGPAVSFDVYLRPGPVELEGVEARVAGTDAYTERLERSLELQGYYQRLAEGFGYFRTPEQLQQRPPFRPADIFRGIPGMDVGRVTGTPGTSGIITMDCAGGPGSGFGGGGGRGGFAVYIDGSRVFLGTEFDMLNYVQPHDVYAAEIYTRVSALPIEYSALGVCGAILIWTG